MSDRQVTALLIHRAFNCGESQAARLAIELTESEAVAINTAGVKNLRRVEQLVEKARQRIAETDAAIQFAAGATGPASAPLESPDDPDLDQQPEGLVDPAASDPESTGSAQGQASNEPTVVTGETLAEPVAPEPAS